MIAKLFTGAPAVANDCGLYWWWGNIVVNLELLFGDNWGCNSDKWFGFMCVNCIGNPFADKCNPPGISCVGARP